MFLIFLASMLGLFNLYLFVKFIAFLEEDS